MTTKKTISLRSAFTVICACIFLICSFTPFAAAENKRPITLRLDTKDPKGELQNLRIITKGQYKFKKLKKDYGIPNTYRPAEDGLDTLNASASGQFSESQFHKLADELRKQAKGKKIYIFDTREECHGFLNGIPVSWYSLYNWANAGRSSEEIEKEEKKRLDSLVGKTVTAYEVSSDKITDEKVEIKVTDAKTERELVESEGFTYIRIPCSDHAWPQPDKIDTFIDFIKENGTENIWPHFHCKAGEGRTGVFIIAYDMIKNLNVHPVDIIIRHAYLGSSYALNQGTGNHWKDGLSLEKMFYTVLFWCYIQLQAPENFKLRWSDVPFVHVYSYNDPWDAVEDANSRSEWLK